MSKKENHHSSTADAKTLGDISIIRNILMGQQMSEYQEQFAQLNNRLDLMEKAFNAQIKNLDQEHKDRHKSMEKEMTHNFKRLEKLIIESTEALDKKLEKVSYEDKKRLGKMMGDLSKKLIGE
ncbi:MAG: hypothetical protein AAGD05_10465 [Bacteroidota bacterium]